jgi:threonine dehydrogenase-like Zn-dependent dehydrogenase
MEIREVAEPVPGPEDVVVQVGCVGLCGSDFNAYRGTSPMVTIRASSYKGRRHHRNAGPSASNSARVRSRFRTRCGSCPACRWGERIRAVNQTPAATDGALCERFAITTASPQAETLQELALVEPLAEARTAEPRGSGRTTPVLGCGRSGSAPCRKTGSAVIAGIDEASSPRAWR